MKKAYQLKSNAIQGDSKVIDITPTPGKAPVTVQAAAAARYELLDLAQRSAPDNIRALRKGKDLHIYLDGDSNAAAVIENFYDVHVGAEAVVVGKTDQGELYSYVPENASWSALITQMTDTGKTYGMALGGDPLGASGAGAAVAALAFNPMLLGAALLGAAALGGGGGSDGGVVISDPNKLPNTGEKTAISLNPVTDDNIITVGENKGNIALTGKVSGNFAANDIVTLYVNGKAYTGKTAADGSFSIAVAASDLAADKDTQIEAKVTGTGGDTANAAQDYVVETASTAGKPTALSIDPITEDNLVNAAEAGATLDITGKVTGAFTTDDQITLTVNGKTFTGTPKSDGTFKIAVHGSDLAADTDTTVDAAITGASAIQNYGLDTAPPLNSSNGVGLNITMATDADNNAWVSANELGTSTTLTSHVRVNSTAKAGDKVHITASNGSTALDAVTHILTVNDIQNGFNVTFAKPEEDQIQTVTATFIDAAGNAATDAAVSDAATLDTTAPQNSKVALGIAITSDTDNNGAIGPSELNRDATTFTSHISVNSTAVVGDKVVVSASNGNTNLSPITRILTADDISKGFDVTFAKPTDGQTQTVTANFVDAAGNPARDTAATDNAKLDFTAPDKPNFIGNDDVEAYIGTIVSNSTTNDARPEFSGMTEALSTVKIFDGIVLIGTTVADATGAWSFTPTTALAQGSHSIRTKATDPAGNTSPESNPLDFKVDSLAPANVGLTIAIQTDANNDGYVNSTEKSTTGNLFTSHITVNNTAQVGDKIEIHSENDTAQLSVITHVLSANDIANGFDVSFSAPTEGTSQKVTAQYLDAAGNRATDAIVSDQAKLDTTAANISKSLTAQVNNTIDSLEFKPAENGTYTLHIGDQTFKNLPTGGKLFSTTPSFEVQAKDVFFEFSDTAGNQSVAYLVDATSTAKYTITPNTVFTV